MSVSSLQPAPTGKHRPQRFVCEVIVSAASQSSLQAPIPDFAKGNGLLPAVAQDAKTGEVLMVAYMNPESFAETVTTGRAVYFSRSKGRLWRKAKRVGTCNALSKSWSTVTPTPFS